MEPLAKCFKTPHGYDRQQVSPRTLFITKTFASSRHRALVKVHLKDNSKHHISIGGLVVVVNFVLDDHQMPVRAN